MTTTHKIILLFLLTACLYSCATDKITPLADINTNTVPQHFLDPADKASVDAFITHAQAKSEPSARKLLANYYNNLGVVADLQNLSSNAIAYHRKALDLRIAFGEQTEAAKSYNNLAIVYASQGNYETAASLYEQAVDLFDKNMSTKTWQAHTLRNYALCLMAQGKTDLAKEKLSDALAIWQQLGDDTQTNLVQKELTSLPVGGGDVRIQGARTLDGPPGSGDPIRFIEGDA